MSDFQQQAIRLAAQQQAPAWLAPLRQQAAESWLNCAWPTRKTEHWKYTPLSSLQKGAFSSWSDGDKTHVGSVNDESFIAIDATRLVFVNGVFDAERSSDLPVEVVRFSAANAAQQALIATHLGKVVEGEQHLFAILASAWTDDGVLLHVPHQQQLNKPVYIVHLSVPTAEPAVVNQRLLVVLDEGAKATLVEHYVSTAKEQNGFVNVITEMVVGDNAELQHYRLNLEEENILHVGAVHASLQRNARFRGFTLAQGSRLKRIDYQINHCGEGAELDLQGVYLPRNNQLVDYHTNIRHMVPRCTTREIFRGIISDSAHAVFNGRIYIHPHAQKTLAELSNKNLLTSNKAEVDTKPELEIYADDVKCAHGATVSQLNNNALYYLQSRGVSRREAEVMMRFGFINELLEQIVEPSVQDYLRPHLARLFGRDNDLLEQIYHG